MRPAPGALLASRYELVRPLGDGARGPLWLARDRVLALTEVAIELASPAAWERTVRDATLARGLEHPRLVRLIHLEPGDPPFLVWEYVPGLTLARDLAARGQPLSPARALEIVQDLAPALDHAHARGVVVRDLDSARVAIGGGAARLAYVGLDPAGAARPDVRALGALVHEMLTREDAGGEGHPALDAVPAPIARTVRRALAPWPPDRPPTATAFARELRDAVHPPPRVTRRRAAIAIALCALIALASAGPRERSRPAPAASSASTSAPTSTPTPTPTSTSTSTLTPTRPPPPSPPPAAPTPSSAEPAASPGPHASSLPTSSGPPKRSPPRASLELGLTAPDPATYVTGGFSLAPSKLKLAYTFPPGDVLAYSTLARMRSELRARDGNVRRSETAIEIVFDQVLAETLADGFSRITTRVRRAEQFTDGKPGPGPAPTNVTFRATIKPNGEVLAGEIPRAVRLDLVLPDHPVGAGDSWERSEQLGEPVRGTATTRYTVGELNATRLNYDGRLVEIDTSLAVDSAELDEVRGSGRILFDAERGRIVQIQSRFTLGLKISQPAKEHLASARFSGELLVERFRR